MAFSLYSNNNCTSVCFIRFACQEAHVNGIFIDNIDKYYSFILINVPHSQPKLLHKYVILLAQSLGRQVYSLLVVVVTKSLNLQF